MGLHSLQDMALILLSKQCYRQLLSNYDIINVPCMTHVFSKLVGYGVIVAISLYAEMPRIVRLLHRRHGDDLDLFTQVLNLLLQTFTVTYCICRDFPISTWGENIVLMVQTLSICCLLHIYQDRRRSAIVFTVIYVMGMLLLLLPIVPPQLYTLLLLFFYGLIYCSRLLQAWQGYSYKDTGEKLSPFGVTFMWVTSAGRLVTILLETQDSVQLLMYSSTLLLNTLLLLQLLYNTVRTSLKTKASTMASRSRGRLGLWRHQRPPVAGGRP